MMSRTPRIPSNLRAPVRAGIVLAMACLAASTAAAQTPTLAPVTSLAQTATDSGKNVTVTFTLSADIPFFKTSDNRFIYPAPGSQLFAKATIPEYPAGRKGTATFFVGAASQTAASGEEAEFIVPADGYTALISMKVVYPAGEYGTPKQYYPELTVWSPGLKTGFLQALVEHRDAFGKTEVLPEVNRSYPGFANILYAHALTTNKDLTSLAFRIQLKRAHEGVDEPSYVKPAIGNEVRVTLTATYDKMPQPVLAGAWAVSDSAGDAVSNVGGGGTEIELPACRAPSPYIRLQVVTPNYAYANKKFLLDKTERVKDLHFVVKDIDGQPIKDAAVSVLSGGPLAFITGNAVADAAGKCTIKVRADGDARPVEARMLPKIWVTTCKLTQLVDEPGAIFPGRQAFVNVPLSIDHFATTYDKRDKSVDAGLVTLKLTNSQNAQVGADFKCDEIFRGDTLTDFDRAWGRDRAFMPLPAVIAPGNYIVQAWAEDKDANVVDKNVMLGSYAYFAVRDYWFKYAKRDTPLRFQFVPVAHEGVAFPSASLPDHVEWFNRVFPGEITFSTGPGFRPSSPFWAKDVARVTSMMSDLENYRAQAKLDLVIGVVPPGGIDTLLKGKASGLSISSQPRVVLIDSSRALPYHTLHEFLHTRGLNDDYGRPGVPPPSADGYDDARKLRVENWSTLPAYPQNEALMYDYSGHPWPTIAEYQAMMNYAAKPAASPQSIKRLAAAQKVMSITGAIRCLNPDAYSNYQYEVIHDPIFTDWGEPDMPQGELSPVSGISNYMMGGVETISTSGASLGKAWRSLGMVLSNGAQQPDGYITTLRFMAPWSDGLKEIRLGYLPYAQPDKPITAIKTLTVSANAPAVAWTSKPASGASLGGSVALEFTAGDADGDKLYAWLKYSPDGGTTWQPVANWFPIASGANQASFNCADYPAGSTYRFRLLVSDGVRTTAIEAGTYTLAGYSPVGVARLGASSYSVATNPGLPLTIALPVRNTGRGDLIVGLDPASAPAWMNANDKTRQWRILPGVEEILTWRTSALALGTHTATLKLTTNNPATPTIDFPVTLVVVATPQAPSIGAMTTQPRLAAGEPMNLTSRMRFTAYEKTGRAGLDARITVEQVSPAKIVLDKAAMGDQGAGRFVCDWDVPADARGKQYTAEITVRDPNTGLADANGLSSQGADLAFDVAPGVNHAPVLTSPSYPESTNPGSLVVTRGGNELVFDYSVSDPDGDPVFLSVRECSIPFYWDQARRQVRMTPGTVSAMVDTRLVIAAADPYGGVASKEWKIRIFPWTADWQFERAIPVQQDGTVIAGSPLKLEARCYNSYQWGKGCRFEYRKLGSSAWQSSGLIAYKWDVTLQCLRAQWDWKTSGLTAGACYEVRYVGVDSEGNDAELPPVQRFFMAGQGAGVTKIEAPSTVEAGKSFTMRIHVKNSSAYTWTLASGHKVGATSSTDPFAKGKLLSLSSMAQVPPGATAIYACEVAAPSTPGSYATRWQPYQGSSYYGMALSKTIVVAAALPFPAAELRDYLLGKWTPGSTWLAKADLNGDGKITVADLIQHYRLADQLP